MKNLFWKIKDVLLKFNRRLFFSDFGRIALLWDFFFILKNHFPHLSELYQYHTVRYWYRYRSDRILECCADVVDAVYGNFIQEIKLFKFNGFCPIIYYVVYVALKLEQTPYSHVAPRKYIILSLNIRSWPDICPRISVFVQKNIGIDYMRTVPVPNRNK